MDTELNPKLLDVVEFRGDEGEFGLAGPVTGAVVEFLAPETALIEVSDEEGMPTDLITRQVEQVKRVWSVGVPPTETAATGARTSFERGFLLLQNGLILDARSHFKQAFEIEPKLAGTLMNSASDLAKNGGFDVAILIYELIQELQPHYALARENLTWIVEYSTLDVELLIRHLTTFMPLFL
jgi:lipoprotein NlpI